MNLKVLALRILQLFSLLVLAYVIYYNFFLEEQLSNSKFYRRAYSLSMLWMSLIHLYLLYQLVLKTGQKPALKSDNP